MSNPQRKKRTGPRQIVPDYVRTFDSRETSMLAKSDLVLKKFDAPSIIVPQTVKKFGMKRLSVKELEDLLIDTRYQRDEVTAEVNTLIRAIRAGGIIPDPISIVERKYGDKKSYIVDGQQRWWAHVDTQTPIDAVIYHVTSLEDEITLFHALNLNSRISAESRIKSWPGPAGDSLRRLGGDETSPLKGAVSFTQGSHRIGGMILLRGLDTCLTNSTSAGSLEKISARFDRAYKSAPRIADKMIDGYAQIIARLFLHTPNQRLSSVVAIGLGKVCYAAFTENKGEPKFPTEKQFEKLLKVDWRTLVPTHAVKWLPIVLDTITNIWPVDVVREKKGK